MALKMRGGNQLIDAVEVLQKGGIKEGITVVDLGCGATGHFVFPAAHLVGPQGKVYAIDLLKSVLDSVESRRKMEGVDNVEIIWADLERPNSVRISNASADLVLIINTLGQVGEKEILAKEAGRIIKPGGTLVLADWKATYSPLGPPVERRMDESKARAIVENAGFIFSEKFEGGPYHWGMVFKK